MSFWKKIEEREEMFTITDIEVLIYSIGAYFVLFLLVGGGAFLFHHFYVDV